MARSRRTPRPDEQPQRVPERLAPTPQDRPAQERHAHERPAPTRGAGAYAERGRGQNRRGRAFEEDDPPVVGMGDHVPMFMQRAVKLKPLKVAEEQD
jgi:hypothetical protein